MIQEYYLHMFCGVNGEHDQSTGAGRLAIAALMAGYGLNASTKKDLQTRVEWRTTPGCFLGQKELTPTDYYCRNYEETRFAIALVPLRKVNRTMNYQLDWSILDGEWDFRVISPIWINLAKIYWLGYFLFGRNVLPETVITKLQSRFSPDTRNGGDKLTILKSPFVMQFMKNIGLPLLNIEQPHVFSESQEDLPRFKVFGSFALSVNWSENSTGFFTMGAMMNTLVPAGANLKSIVDHIREYIDSRCGRFVAGYMPLTQQYYYNFGMGTPSLPPTPSRMSAHGKDIIPLLYCRTDLTPQQEASAGYGQIRGGFNTEYLTYNIQAWMSGAMLWEYHLMLTGEPLFPLEVLTAARQEREWTEEVILDALIYLNPANNKNSSVAQIVRFNLERQTQV